MNNEYQAQRGANRLRPILKQEYRRRDGSTGAAPVIRAKSRDRNEVKWLTPSAYQRWKRIGLGGYGPSGLRQSNWRGRNDGRNMSFAELLWSSGLRLNEAATLLTAELPSKVAARKYVSGKLARSTGKGGAARRYWVSSRALTAIDNYVSTTRQLAITRAQAEGR